MTSNMNLDHTRCTLGYVITGLLATDMVAIYPTLVIWKLKAHYKYVLFSYIVTENT
jgi:hypothetical protein